MSLQKYEVLLRALDCGSLTQAAEELAYTQSGASYMIKSLEDELGFPLLVRTRTGVLPTADCTRLLPSIRELMKWSEAISDAASAIKGVEAGSVTVGCFQSISVHWMPHVIEAFLANHPNIRLQLMEGELQEMDVWMQERKIDMTFATHQKEWRYEWIPLAEDGMYAVLPPSHPLAGAERFPAEAFRNAPFVMPALGFDLDVMKVMDNIGVPPKIRFTTMDIYGAMAMVECGLGISIMPGLMLKKHDYNVAALPIDPPQHRKLGIALAMPSLSPAAAAFVKCAREVVAKL